MARRRRNPTLKRSGEDDADYAWWGGVPAKMIERVDVVSQPTADDENRALVVVHTKDGGELHQHTWLRLAIERLSESRYNGKDVTVNGVHARAGSRAFDKLAKSYAVSELARTPERLRAKALAGDYMAYQPVREWFLYADNTEPVYRLVRETRARWATDKSKRQLTRTRLLREASDLAISVAMNYRREFGTTIDDGTAYLRVGDRRLIARILADRFESDYKEYGAQAIVDGEV